MFSRSFFARGLILSHPTFSGDIYMKSILMSMIIGAGALLATSSFAQTPSSSAAAAPAGSTGMCKDGSYWTGATKKGACRGHKGVQDWYAATPDAAAPAAPAAPPAPAAAPAAAAPAPMAPARTMAPASTNMPATAAPGGGPGQVWANKSTKVYHCPTDKWYGKTKNGEYMTEHDAVAKGFHADHGKAC
jgi:hypothetical protein